MILNSKTGSVMHENIDTENSISPDVQHFICLKLSKHMDLKIKYINLIYLIIVLKLNYIGF